MPTSSAVPADLFKYSNSCVPMDDQLRSFAEQTLNPAMNAYRLRCSSFAVPHASGPGIQHGGDGYTHGFGTAFSLATDLTQYAATNRLVDSWVGQIAGAFLQASGYQTNPSTPAQIAALQRIEQQALTVEDLALGIAATTIAAGAASAVAIGGPAADDLANQLRSQEDKLSREDNASWQLETATLLNELEAHHSDPAYLAEFYLHLGPKALMVMQREIIACNFSPGDRVDPLRDLMGPIDDTLATAFRSGNLPTDYAQQLFISKDVSAFDVANFLAAGDYPDLVLAIAGSQAIMHPAPGPTTGLLIPDWATQIHSDGDPKVIIFSVLAQHPGAAHLILADSQGADFAKKLFDPRQFWTDPTGLARFLKAADSPPGDVVFSNIAMGLAANKGGPPYAEVQQALIALLPQHLGWLSNAPVPHVGAHELNPYQAVFAYVETRPDGRVDNTRAGEVMDAINARLVAEVNSIPMASGSEATWKAVHTRMLESFNLFGLAMLPITHDPQIQAKQLQDFDNLLNKALNTLTSKLMGPLPAVLRPLLPKVIDDLLKPPDWAHQADDVTMGAEWAAQAQVRGTMVVLLYAKGVIPPPPPNVSLENYLAGIAAPPQANGAGDHPPDYPPLALQVSELLGDGTAIYQNQLPINEVSQNSPLTNRAGG